MSPAPTLGRAGPPGTSPGGPPGTSSGAGTRGFVTAAALVAVAVHLWGLYRDHGPPSVPWFTHADKLEHLVGFGLPCFLVLLALDLRAGAAGAALRGRTVALVVGAFVVHAGVSEVVQGAFYTTRSGDPYDTLADLVGTALGRLAYLLLLRARRARRAGDGGGARRRTGTR